MKQKEIWWLNLDPTEGAEIRKKRPCVIVSDDSMGILPLKIIVPITDFKTRYASIPWMVVLKADSINQLTKDSVIDVFQIRCVSEARFISKIGTITDLQLDAIKKALKVVFNLT